jgi:S-ribosylhomocysteine lyase
MGCCTGNYLILQGEHSTRTVAALMLEMFEWIAAYDGEVPGATARDCGNYTFMDLEGARRAAQHYVDHTLRNITDNHLTYPE